MVAKRIAVTVALAWLLLWRITGGQAAANGNTPLDSSQAVHAIVTDGTGQIWGQGDFFMLRWSGDDWIPVRHNSPELPFERCLCVGPDGAVYSMWTTEYKTMVTMERDLGTQGNRT